jgi:hypothetical protein
MEKSLTICASEKVTRKSKGMGYSSDLRGTDK